MVLSLELLALVGVGLTLFTGIIGFVVARQDRLVCDLRRFLIDRQDKALTAHRADTTSLRREDKAVVELANERINQLNNDVARRADLDDLRTDIRDLKTHILSRIDKIGVPL